MNEKEKIECRKAFEEWAVKLDSSLETDCCGWYVDELTACAFSGWKEAWNRRVAYGLFIAALDSAFTQEIKRVYEIEYDSNAICRHFYGKVRENLLCALRQC